MNSLQRRTFKALALLASSLVLVGMVSASLYWWAGLDDEFRAFGEAEAGGFQAIVASMEPPRKEQTLSPLLQALYESQDTVLAAVYDRDGFLLARKADIPVDLQLPREIVVGLVKHTLPMPVMRHLSTHTEFILPTMGQDQAINGFVRLGISRYRMRREVYDIVLFSGSLFVALTLLSVALSWALSRRLTAPLLGLLREIKVGKSLQDLAGLSQSSDSEEVTLLAGLIVSLDRDLEKHRRSLLDLREHLDEEVKRRTNEIQATGDFVRLLNSDLELDRILDAALRALVLHTSSQVGIVYLQKDDSRLMPAASWGLPLEDLVRRGSLAFGQGVPGEAARRKERLALEDLPEDLDLRLETGICTIVPRSVLATPMIFGDCAEGVLLLAGLRPYSKDSIEFVDNSVAQLAITIHNAHAYQRAQELARELETHNLELQEKRRTLEEQKSKLMEMNRLKTELLAAVSHELLTPINIITGSADLLLEGAFGLLAPEQAGTVRDIEEAARELVDIINNILDMAKLEAGKVAVSVEEVELSALLGDLMKGLQSKVEAEGKEITLRWKVDPASWTVWTDAHHLRKILEHLLANAIKFTPRGSIVLEALPAPDGGVILAVEDTGIGIAYENHEAIFDLFRQVDGSLTRSFGGTGIGLAIVRRLARLLGGEVRVRSELGAGARFEVVLAASTEATREMRVEREVG